MIGTLFIAAIVVFFVVFIALPLAYFVLCFAGWCIIMAAALIYAAIAYIVGKVDHICRKLTT